VGLGLYRAHTSVEVVHLDVGVGADGVRPGRGPGRSCHATSRHITQVQYMRVLDVEDDVERLKLRRGLVKLNM